MWTVAEVQIIKECLADWFADPMHRLVSFYFQLHDNIVKELVFVGANPDQASFLACSVKHFIQSPAAEGGCSLYGILNETKTVMLTALYEPGLEICIDLHHRVGGDAKRSQGV